MRIGALVIYLLIFNLPGAYSGTEPNQYRIEIDARIQPNEDTLKALLKLKKRSNRKSRVSLIIGTVGITGAILSLTTPNDGHDSALDAFFIGFFAGQSTIAILHLAKNNKYFKKIIEDYKNGIALPKNIKASFLPRDFN